MFLFHLFKGVGHERCSVEGVHISKNAVFEPFVEVLPGGSVFVEYTSESCEIT